MTEDVSEGNASVSEGNTESVSEDLKPGMEVSFSQDEVVAEGISERNPVMDLLVETAIDGLMEKFPEQHRSRIRSAIKGEPIEFQIKFLKKLRGIPVASRPEGTVPVKEAIPEPEIKPLKSVI